MGADFPTEGERRKRDERLHRGLLPALAALEQRARPFWCYARMPNTFSFGLEDLDDCEDLVLCFGTLGAGVREAVDAAFARKEYTAGYLLDRLADEWLFQGAGAVDRRVWAGLQKEGYGATRKHAPGDPDLSLLWQKPLFSALQAEGEIPGRVNEHSVLWPDKSLLYLFGADRRLKGMDRRHPCMLCQKAACTYCPDKGKKSKDGQKKGGDRHVS